MGSCKWLLFFPSGKNFRRILLALLMMWNLSHASEPKFQLRFLGDHEGPSRLSALLIAPHLSSDFVAINAGTLSYLTQIRAYLISQPHLNHLQGLVNHSSIDHRKNIYGLEHTIRVIRDHIFNWQVWPNYADEGTLPHLARYHYVRLLPETPIHIPKTKLSLQAFPLSHPKGSHSTCFFIEHEQSYFVYIGASLHQEDDLVWEQIAALIMEKKCAALFFETADFYPELELVGIQSMKEVYKTLSLLARKISPNNPSSALSGLPILISQPPSLGSALQRPDELGVRWVFLKTEQTLEL